MTLKAEEWVEAVTERGRRFMAAWRKEEVDAVRHRQAKGEAERLGKLYRTRKRRILRSDTPIGLADDRKKPCTDARWTKACVAPRHDASRFFFLRTNSGRGGGGGARALPDFFSPCSADHERDWPPIRRM